MPSGRDLGGNCTLFFFFPQYRVSEALTVLSLERGVFARQDANVLIQRRDSRVGLCPGIAHSLGTGAKLGSTISEFKASLG